jgi:hypothetical protein
LDFVAIEGPESLDARLRNNLFSLPRLESVFLFQLPMEQVAAFRPAARSPLRSLMAME